jgi:3-dehydroquinate synthase
VAAFKSQISASTKADRLQTPTAPASTTYLQRFSVPYEYPVSFTRNALDPENRVLLDAIRRCEPTRRHRIHVVVDAGVCEAWPRLVEDLTAYARRHDSFLELAAIDEVPGGEQVKQSTEYAHALQRRIYERSIDRQSFVLAIGGGAVLDMAGYAAATAHRGVRLVRMPTTVGAQNDSGVGVKNAINAFGIKNFIGSFAPPFAVINDTAFLDTLPIRERIAGMAEAVKVALIRDADFYEWLSRHRDDLYAFSPEAVDYMVRRSAELHMDHIAQAGDPFECGSAKPLDFGHWAAHKIESLSEHEVRHGEAVAIGIALDCRYAVECGLLRDELCERICCLLEDLGFTLWHRVVAECDATGRRWLLDGIAEFREHLGGELTLTMISDIGVGHDIHYVDPAIVEVAVDWLEKRSPRR